MRASGPSRTELGPAEVEQPAEVKGGLGRDRLLVVFALVAVLVAAVRIASHDPGDLRVKGDAASFVYNSLSLADGNLSYDARDQQRWQELRWDDQPHGLFLQRRSDGWAFAKPYGYSVLLAAPLSIFGLRGVAYLGAVMLIAYTGCWYAIGRLRWPAPTAAAVAASAAVASHAWLYGFPAHADLFVAVLVGVAVAGSLRARLHREPLSLLVAAAACGLLVTEKLPAFAALIPLLIVAGWHHRGRWQASSLVVATLVAAVSMVPYLHYSDGQSWSAYGGDRYYAPGRTPWSGGTEAELRPWPTSELITVDYAVDRLTHPPADLPAATLTYAVGRDTGVLTFSPIIPALLVSAFLARRHRIDRASSPPPRDDPPGDRNMLLAACLGLGAYVGFYLVLFTENYYGGAQSIGNRYFLQISVLAAAIPVAAGVGRGMALRAAAFAATWALIVLGPNLLHADRAFHDLSHTSVLQRLLPRETTQAGQLFSDDSAE